MKETNKHREVKWLKLKNTKNSASVSLNLCFLANSVGCSPDSVSMGGSDGDSDFLWFLDCFSMKDVHELFCVMNISETKNRLRGDDVAKLLANTNYPEK